jgi:tetratricopeptide (TPR) repeat protein
VPYNRISIPALFCVIAGCAQAHSQASAETPSSMHLRAPAAFILLSLALALASVRPALAALADELSEVTRLHHAGQSQAALERADRFLAGKPKDAQMRFLKSVVLADSGKRVEAAELLNQLAQDFPELAEPHNNLAALHAAAGEYAQARAELEESIRLNPGYATAQENLGDVYAILAAEAYGRAQRLDPGSTALPRKLALIRELAGPEAGRAAASRPVATPKTGASPKKR